MFKRRVLKYLTEIRFFSFRSIRDYAREKKNNSYFYLEIIITATKVKHTSDVIRNWQPFDKQHGLVFFFFLLFFFPLTGCY